MANNSPVIPLTPNCGGATFAVAITAANTALDGTGTVNTIYTAGASGGFLDSVSFLHAGTNSSATVARVFLNNGSANTTAHNNILIGEVSIAANTLTQAAASIPYPLPIKKNIPANFVINVTIGTAASAGILACPFAMDY